MDSKSRSGRFDLSANKLVEDFNATIMIEQRNCPFDIRGSQAHATMLGKQGIIPKEDAEAICRGLDQVAQEIRDGKFIFRTADEDIHMAIEKRMTEIVGPAGGRLHTGRSRNDQTTTTTKMMLRHTIREVQQAICELQRECVELAARHLGVIMPGYTHMQTGQPILFSHWIMAYFWMLERDFTRFDNLYTRMGYCPLGAAALAGTDFPIDRFMTAKALGFDAPTENSIDSVSDRDHMVEFNACAAMCYMHLSRLSEELVIFSTQDFKFIELSDDFCTGSSIMPQKKNPDIAEKIRGKTGRVYGNLMAMFTIMKGLPLAYNTDLSEDKEQVFDSIDTLLASLRIMTPMIAKMTVNGDVTREAADRGYSNATDLADYLARKGVPFREAHHVVGSMVNYCIKHGKKLDDLTIEEYKQFNDKIEEDIRHEIALDTCVKARKSYGGTAPEAVQHQLSVAREVLARQESACREQ
ncbi:MAG: argininosuccinate lyase [Candidatus Aphodousia sp.]|nr:argininosuccinate lyase [Sutterella sp.]MDY2899869.1 argininosuccinate lyase [Candidatus Aphodousia sp.]